MNRLFLLLFLAAPIFAQQGGPPPSKALFDVRKRAYDALTAMKQEMAKKGCKGECDDCDEVIRKVLEPAKPIAEKGNGSAWPGDDAYEEVLKAWSDLGKQLAGIYSDAAGSLEGKEKDEAELLGGWFGTWGEAANGIRRLNRRRKFSKLAPVTERWAGSFGGYLHGRYLQLNANDPSVAGLGAHDEQPGKPGYSNEGAEAAHGILGGGGAEGSVDMWCGSRFHRDPVLNRNVGRVNLGGLPNGWWSCRASSGPAPKQQPDVVVFPGDGDTEVSAMFFGEAPNPFPPGVNHAGTCIYVEFFRARPKKATWKLLDPDGKDVDLLFLDDKTQAAKEALKPHTKYTVEILGQDGFKFTSSFTTN